MSAYHRRAVAWAVLALCLLLVPIEPGWPLRLVAALLVGRAAYELLRGEGYLLKPRQRRPRR